MLGHGAGLEQAVVQALQQQAEHAAVLMRNRAPKWRSTLTNSVLAQKVSDFEWHIGPSVAYAPYVEEGRGPGKGLPRWDDPAATDIKAWLESKAFKGVRRGRGGSALAANRTQELRDRYQGLAWHVRHHGVKAQPFVRPTFEAMGRVFAPRMEQAARDYLAKSGAGGGAGGGGAA